MVTARPGLLAAVVASLLAILPGSHQYPQHVVFQPVTYQLPSTGSIDPDLSLVFPSTFRKSSEAPEDTSSQLICKKIQHGDGLFRISPSTQASQLFFIPTAATQNLIDGPFSRFFVAVPSVPVSAAGIQSEIPEEAFAAPPPLMASLCVSQDSPRPFPVLFAPPPSQFSSIDNDFKKFTDPSDAPLYSTSISERESPLKVSLNAPSMDGVTLGIHGVPATIESSSPSRDDPAGRILVKLHTNPPGIITLGFIGEGRMARKPEELEPDLSTYRGNGILAQFASPSVSLHFTRPVGSVGIGSPGSRSPAVNIEKQNIVASSSKSPKNNIPIDWTLYSDNPFLF